MRERIAKESSKELWWLLAAKLTYTERLRIPNHAINLANRVFKRNWVPLAKCFDMTGILHIVARESHNFPRLGTLLPVAILAIFRVNQLLWHHLFDQLFQNVFFFLNQILLAVELVRHRFNIG